MKTLEQLFAGNRHWASAMTEHDAGFFERLARQQTPQHLWIGCSDSRVPANQIVGLLPGELFVHRNVANLVLHSDLNCLSVIQYAVDVLKVRDVIVCGHYGCGGVLAALRGERLGLIDNWLRSVQDLHAAHRDEIGALPTQERRHERLCELNVVEQVLNLSRTTVIQDAWARGQQVALHGWVYGLHDGLLRDLDTCITNPGEAAAKYRAALRSRRS
jgi:carbonic anhydrase